MIFKDSYDTTTFALKILRKCKNITLVVYFTFRLVFFTGHFKCVIHNKPLFTY